VANAEQIDTVRVLTNEPDNVEPYTDVKLAASIDDASGNLNLIAAKIWREKAAGFAEMVDTSESGSSRKDGVLWERAIKQAEYFESLLPVVEPTPEPGTYSTTRAIVRI
jgi:hypothetical protein